jgi:hypothetical protein
MKIIFSIIILIYLMANPSWSQQSPSSSTLEQRLWLLDSGAMREVRDQRRADLLPLLKQIDGKYPNNEDIQKLCASLGEKKCFDEIVGELLDPTNSAAYARHPESTSDPGLAEWMTICDASDKLAWIGDKSAVKYLIQMLDYNGGLEKRFSKPLSHYTFLGASPKTMAGTVLWKLKLPGAPTNGPGRADVAFIAAWQHWWEEHKDYYEKLEFGQPVPPPPSVSQPASATPKPSQTALDKPSATPAAVTVRENNPSRWLVGILIVLAALSGGFVLLRAKRKQQ